MGKAEVSTTINRPVEDVFAALTRLEDQPKWSSATLEAEQTSPGPIAVGTTARFVAKFLGRRVESDVRVTEFQPNRKLAIENTSGPIPFRSSFTSEQLDRGTRVTAVIGLEPGGFFKLAEPLVIAMAKRQLQGDLSNFKDLMEAGAL